MNQKTPYELQIADKLQQLPLPDMQDAIWARIERTLDIDMPTDDGDGGGSDGGPDTPWWDGTGLGGFVFSMVFVAALTSFIIFKTLNQSTNNGPATDNTPANELTLPQSEDQQPPPGTMALPTRNRVPVRTNDPRLVAGDSVLGEPLVITPPLVQDTATNTTAIVPPPPVTTPATTVDTTRPGRRPRGAQGINPNDYRIVPKRDSTGQ
jgi:hypothetical protein